MINNLFVKCNSNCNDKPFSNVQQQPRNHIFPLLKTWKSAVETKGRFSWDKTLRLLPLDTGHCYDWQWCQSSLSHTKSNCHLGWGICAIIMISTWQHWEKYNIHKSIKRMISSLNVLKSAHHTVGLYFNIQQYNSLYKQQWLHLPNKGLPSRGSLN